MHNFCYKNDAFISPLSVIWILLNFPKTFNFHVIFIIFLHLNMSGNNVDIHNKNSTYARGEFFFFNFQLVSRATYSPFSPSGSDVCIAYHCHSIAKDYSHFAVDELLKLNKTTCANCLPKDIQVKGKTFVHSHLIMSGKFIFISNSTSVCS